MYSISALDTRLAEIGMKMDEMGRSLADQMIKWESVAGVNEALRQRIMSLEKNVYDHKGGCDHEEDGDDLKRRIDEMARQLAYVQGRIAAAEKVVSNLPYPAKESSVPEMGCVAEGAEVKWCPVSPTQEEEDKPVAFYKVYKAEGSKESKVHPACNLRKLDRPIGNFTHIYFPRGDTTLTPQLISTEEYDIVYLYK